MRVAIIGSREIYGYGLDELISHIPQNASELVSGGAAGVDALAEQAAGRLGLPIRVFRPDYDRDRALRSARAQQRDRRVRRPCARLLGRPVARHGGHPAQMR